MKANWWNSTHDIDFARLFAGRFGTAAPDAWRRAFQNSCTDEEFWGLVYNGTHTANCYGQCMVELARAGTNP